MAINLRLVTGSYLTYEQVDENFSSLFYSASKSGSQILLHYTGSRFFTHPEGVTNGLSSFVKIPVNEFPFTGSAIVSGSFTVTGSVKLEDKVYLQQGLNSVQYANFTNGTTTRFKVTVDSKQNHYYTDGWTSGYYLDGVESPYLSLSPGTYVFDQSHPSNIGYRLAFYQDLDRTRQQFTGTLSSAILPGNSGSEVVITVNESTPSPLYYQCTTRPKMGWALETINGVVSAGFPYTGSARITGSLDLTGSFKVTGADATFDNNLIVKGTIQAKQFLVSSSIVDIVTIKQSGSTEFGDSLDDTHILTGSLHVTSSDFFYKGLSGSNQSYALAYDTASGKISFMSTASFIVNPFPYTGSARITGSLDVTGSIDFTGSYTMEGSSSYNGSVLHIGVGRHIGTQRITGSLYNVGTTRITGSLNTTGSAKVVGKQEVTGSSEVLGTFKVKGNTLLSGSTRITGSLNISSSQIYVRHLSGANQAYAVAYDTASGKLTYMSTASFIVNPFPYTGSARITGSFDVTGSSKLSGSLKVTGSTSFRGLVEQTGLGESTYFGQAAGRRDDKTDNKNTGFGFNALNNVTAGSENTAVGHSAGVVVGSGTGNTATGFQSLYTLQGGQYNTAIGRNALLFTNGAFNNTALGAGAGASITTGNDNTAIGASAIPSLKTGAGNTAVGYYAGRNLVSGSAKNVMLGYDAGPLNTSTLSNKLYIHNAQGTPLIGGDFSSRTVQISGSLYVTGGLIVTSSKVYFKRLSGSKQSYALTYDTASGKITYMSTASFIVAPFPYTGSAKITGSLKLTGSTSFNGLVSQTGLGGATYFGDQAGKSDKRLGTQNTGIGEAALSLATSGYENTAVGNYAGWKISTGNDNTALGFQTLQSTTDGTNNTAVGARSIYSNNGADNTAVGFSSLTNLANGSGNTALGSNAGRYANAGSSRNLFVGKDAGPTSGQAGVFTRKLYIADTAGTPLIGGDFANKYVTINGNTHFTGSFNVTGSSVSLKYLPKVSASHVVMYNPTGGYLYYMPSSSIRTKPFPYTGSARITGSLDVTGSVKFKGNQRVTGSISVTGSLRAKGTTTLSGSIQVSGSSRLRGQTRLSGSNFISGSNILRGQTRLTGSLFVTASSIFRGQTRLSGSNFMSGSNIFRGQTRLSGSNFMSGSNIFRGQTRITGSLNVTGSSRFRGQTRLSGSNFMSGSNIFRGQTRLSGSNFISGSNILRGQTRITGSVFTTGNITSKGTVRLTGSFNVTSSDFFYKGLSGSNQAYGLVYNKTTGKVTYMSTASFIVKPFPYTGSARITGSLHVTGSTRLTGSLRVTGSITSNNTVSARSKFIGGTSTATGTLSSVLGGSANSVTGNYSVVGGGQNNVNSGGSSVLGGGLNNTLSAGTGFIGGGSTNSATGTGTVVVGGSDNKAVAGRSFVGGGSTNIASASYSVVVGGLSNTITKEYSGILGGHNNTINHTGSFIIGKNLISTEDNATFVNSLIASADVQGLRLEIGDTHTHSGTRSAIVGGQTNNNSGTDSVIIGGVSSTVSGQNSVSIGTGNNIAFNNTIVIGANIRAKAADSVYLGRDVYVTGSLTQGSGSSSVIETVKRVVVSTGKTDLATLTNNYYSGFEILYTAASGSNVKTSKLLGTLYNKTASFVEYSNGGTFGKPKINLEVDYYGGAFKMYATGSGTYQIKYRLTQI
jgi:hypothetical protein